MPYTPLRLRESSIGDAMTDDTLWVECEKHLRYMFGAYLERDVVKLMRFARAQQAKGLREAGQEIERSYEYASKDYLTDWCEAEAKKREKP